MDDTTRMALDVAQSIMQQIEAGQTSGSVGFPSDKRIGEEGAGWIRLIVGPGPAVEYCFLCGCRKSGWINMENPVSDDCPNTVCLCHTAERIQ